MTARHSKRRPRSRGGDDDLREACPEPVEGESGEGPTAVLAGTVCLSPDPFTLHLPPSSPSSAQDDKHGDGQAMGVKITDTTLRDAHQSLLATRMRTEDMLPIAEEIDSAGYHSVEIWGGAKIGRASCRERV